MIEYINECCYCAVGGYPCNNQHKKVPYFVCDKCKDEVSDLYILNGEELCERCVFEKLERVVLE